MYIPSKDPTIQTFRPAVKVHGVQLAQLVLVQNPNIVIIIDKEGTAAHTLMAGQCSCIISVFHF